VTGFGETIRLLRGDRSQMELAAKVGLHPSMWSRYEKGVNRPRQENFARVLVALGCTLEEFEEARWLVGQGTRRLYSPEDAPDFRRRVRFVLDGLAASLAELLVALLAQPSTTPARTHRTDRDAPGSGKQRAAE
jgi:transcriptional regulator with XRE-family HTH domain